MSRLTKQFTATLRKGPNKGAWTYVVMPGSAKFFGTHKLPIKADVRKTDREGSR